MPSLPDRLATTAVAAALSPPLTDNVDPERFPQGMAPRTPDQAAERLAHLLDHADDLAWLESVLEPGSRALLADKLRFHVLGHEHARIGPGLDEVRELLRVAETELIVQRDVTPLRFAGSAASHLFDLAPLGFPITLESYLLGVQGTFQLQQYISPTVPAARPRPGDVAIDAGGCFGETALWLAHAAGPGGRVVCLEFGPENLPILEANLDRNPQLARRIALEPAALWRTSGQRLPIAMGGPASSIAGAGAGAGASAPEPDTAVAPTVALDDLVLAHGLPHVDFVKMDIEGAETAALEGAVRTLAAHRPRLALAVYHEIDHLWQLPRRLAELGLGYGFALGHFTAHDEETVLYAWPQDEAATAPG
jgi:FkbM family methyltransferase